LGNPLYAIKDMVTPVRISDVLRVHDYNYLKKVIDKNEALQQTENEVRIRYDRDCHISKHTWESSLISCGAVVEAVDAVMKGDVKNAFCAIRPPGHHAGVYGKTM
jgi:acetoin utilization deacetylase AcuC-like enzyme